MISATDSQPSPPAFARHRPVCSFGRQHAWKPRVSLRRRADIVAPRSGLQLQQPVGIAMRNLQPVRR